MQFIGFAESKLFASGLSPHDLHSDSCAALALPVVDEIKENRKGRFLAQTVRGGGWVDLGNSRLKEAVMVLVHRLWLERGLLGTSHPATTQAEMTLPPNNLPLTPTQPLVKSSPQTFQPLPLLVKSCFGFATACWFFPGPRLKQQSTTYRSSIN
uniref:Uncharacterized protein n=1 Tax=Trieres chinensis TaxID=1514140 RepID=A0A7S1Z740_TRICV|mmetsp:Transcript_18935/g.38391  ORF Transcript_18935/g.38391 Transcript_18935/m.38391 type:complete len:154 (+) Transcript_18935:133-594(+)